MQRQQARQVEHVNAWSREEVTELLAAARELNPDFHPFLAFLLYTGARKGEALGLRWEDVDFAAGRILIRRAAGAGPPGHAA